MKAISCIFHAYFQFQELSCELALSRCPREDIWFIWFTMGFADWIRPQEVEHFEKMCGKVRDQAGHKVDQRKQTYYVWRNGILS